MTGMSSDQLRKPSVVVIVPTWNRPRDLSICLKALQSQTVLPDRVIVAGKDSDKALLDWFGKNRESIDYHAPVDLVLSPADVNVVKQQNKALDQTTEDIVALTDDDAEPDRDWIQRLLYHFQDPSVGGVGGRDWQPIERGNRNPVGMLSWYGRLIGNHHLGFGPARQVHVLKGVNCAYRGAELRSFRFDDRMRGSGTVINWELAISFAFIRNGYRLIYDPAISVQHHIADRKDGDTNQRGIFEAQSFFDNTYNETLAIYEHLPTPRRIAYRIWSELIGTIGNPGLVQLVRSWSSWRGYLNASAWSRYRTALSARSEAVADIQKIWTNPINNHVQ
jgi:glycosyltransferase involved in cell wall biosynthesis